MRERTGTSLRALASPVSVVSLVVLVLNDHLLKQAWPGVVTGKLSDVAGLVVAPLVLTVGLTAIGVRRPCTWACGLTTAAFTAVKVSPAAAVAVSAWWSLTGFPTVMRADPTDLLALPAVYVAWLVHHRAARQQPVEWRRVVATSAGVALVPLGVVATAATSCEQDDGVRQVWVGDGTWASAPAGLDHRLVVHLDGYYSTFSVDAQGVLIELPAADSSRLDSQYSFNSIGCDGAGACWRIGDSDLPVVEVSTDEGQTWTTELSMTRKEADYAAAGIGAGCGRDPVTHLVDLAVLPVEDGTQVAVAASHGGLLLRSPSGEWRRVSHRTLEAMRALEVTDTPIGVLGQVPDELPPGYPTPGTPESPPPSSPPCPSPTRRTVTPNPSNGPPTSYDVCP